jgi:hypothetical protein
MGDDKIRYFLFVNGRWRWRPTKTMRAAGFRLINMGLGTVVNGKRLATAEDKAQAIRLNESWDRVRRGLPEATTNHRVYPLGSVGDGYFRAMRLRAAERQAKRVVWTAEQHARDDWPRAWKWIEPLFGDCDPKTITPEQLIGDPARSGSIGLRPLVAAKISESEAHRVIKVWRALWKKMAVFGYCEVGRDPSLMFANSAPPPRQALWREGEAVRLIKRAWREGYRGLAACLAVAWDSQLSPIDARGLRAKDQRQDPLGIWFEVARAKTGRAALATLSRRAEWALNAYLNSLAAEPVGSAQIFRNRSGQPYSKDTLGDDFRAIRRLVFGECETRQLADFRRSGSVEALAGDAAPQQLSAKMANTISASNRLHKTYGPAVLASVREVDTARQRGRTKLREQNGEESVTAPAGKVSRMRSISRKPLK